MRHSAARAACLVVCATLFCAGAARADEPEPPKPSDAAAGMLDAMRQKGIITEEEYNDLYKRQAIYELEQREASAIPGWLKEWTFGGDVTVRFDSIDHSGSINVGKPLFAQNNPPTDIVNGVATGKRNRMRLRLRLGAERMVGEDFLVGFRLATSQGSVFGADAGNSNGVDFTRAYTTDPRSAFVTMGSDFAPKGIAVDRAYITWQPHLVEGFTATFGKMPNSFVSPEFSGDFLVWDNDISPEGVVLQYAYNFWGENAWVKVRGSYYTIDEVPAATLQQVNVNGVPTAFPDIDEKDPFMYALQLDTGANVTPFIRIGGRVSYYQMRDINGRTAAAMEDLGNGGAAIKDNPLFAPPFATGAPFETNGASRGQASEIVFDVFTKVVPLEGWTITPWFQLTHMFNADNADYGYGTGVDFMFPTNTKLTFMYASLPRNSTYSIFTDSDFFDGFVNARGWGLTVTQWFNRWTTLRASYYSSQPGSLTCHGIPTTRPGSLECDSSVWENPNLAFYRHNLLDRDRILVDLQVKF